NLSEQWEALRPRLHRLRIWLGTPERTHSLPLLLWPLVGLVIGALVLRIVDAAPTGRFGAASSLKSETGSAPKRFSCPVPQPAAGTQIFHRLGCCGPMCV